MVRLSDWICSENSEPIAGWMQVSVNHFLVAFALCKNHVTLFSNRPNRGLGSSDIRELSTVEGRRAGREKLRVVHRRCGGGRRGCPRQAFDCPVADGTLDAPRVGIRMVRGIGSS